MGRRRHPDSQDGGPTPFDGIARVTFREAFTVRRWKENRSARRLENVMTARRGEFFSKPVRPEILKCDVPMFCDDLVIVLHENFGFEVEVAHDDKSGRRTIKSRDVKLATKFAQYRQ